MYYYYLSVVEPDNPSEGMLADQYAGADSVYSFPARPISFLHYRSV